MKRLSVAVFVSLLALMMSVPASAYVYQDNFETGWTGDYAPGWQNGVYRWGVSPIAKMEQSNLGFNSSHGLKLIASSAQSWMWWGGINVTNIPHVAMETQYNPYVKVQYYDQLGTVKAGQLFAVPDLVTGDEDWTDAQIGGRTGRDGSGGADYSAKYYSIAAPDGWQDSGTSRSAGWHELKIQLSSVDNKLHFSLDGTEIGISTRSDYTNLGTELGLYTRFNSQDFEGTLPQEAYFDKFEVGSTSPVPVPGTVVLLGSGLMGLVIWGRRRLAAKS